MKLRIKRKKGQSLVEAVVAVAVVLLLVTGLIVATTASLRNSSLSKYRTQATNHAKEGMEQVRKLRDTSWQDFITKSGKYCLASTNEWTQLGTDETCPINVGNIFSREVTFTYYPANETMNVLITMYWIEGNWEQSINFVSLFTRWRTDE